eukprot:1732284-Prymnesium_polylepis.1
MPPTPRTPTPRSALMAHAGQIHHCQMSRRCPDRPAPVNACNPLRHWPRVSPLAPPPASAPPPRPPRVGPAR